MNGFEFVRGGGIGFERGGGTGFERGGGIELGGTIQSEKLGNGNRGSVEKSGSGGTTH